MNEFRLSVFAGAFAFVSVTLWGEVSEPLHVAWRIIGTFAAILIGGIFGGIAYAIFEFIENRTRR